jgi:hypothetical protein
MHTEFEVAPLTAVLLYLQLVLSVELAEKSACASFVCLSQLPTQGGSHRLTQVPEWMKQIRIALDTQIPLEPA